MNDDPSQNLEKRATKKSTGEGMVFKRFDCPFQRGNEKKSSVISLSFPSLTPFLLHSFLSFPFLADRESNMQDQTRQIGACPPFLDTSQQKRVNFLLNLLGLMSFFRFVRRHGWLDINEQKEKQAKQSRKQNKQDKTRQKGLYDSTNKKEQKKKKNSASTMVLLGNFS